MREQLTVTRHYYNGNKNFEESVDVYRPRTANDALPLVVLVVGSAWLGHSATIYRPTSWWNSSGPSSIASLGCVCVCVRHRGAYVQPPPPAVVAALVVLVAMAVGCALPHAWRYTFVAALLLSLALHALARGAANHDQMVGDVASALSWVAANRATLGKQDRMVFGGYSSGAHVATTLLTRPDVLASKGLPSPEKLCDGVLLLSGVLGVRAEPPVPADASWARGLPSLIVRLIMGKEAAGRLPSPVHLVGQQPALPHLLIFCEHELFDLQPIERAMGVMFCSVLYAEQLRARGVKTMLMPVQSDHWSVLSSRGLQQALKTALEEKKWP